MPCATTTCRLPAAPSAGRRSTTIPPPTSSTCARRGGSSPPDEFAQAIVKRDAQGRVTRIGDIARVELGAQNYGINAYKSLEPAVSLSVNQAPNTNALETWDNIRSTMEELKTQFPPGVAYEIIFNPVAFTREAVKAVQHTLLEAMILAVHRRGAVPAALAHGDHPAARDSDLADRHARGDGGVRLLAEQPVDVRRWCCRSASSSTMRSSSWRTPSGICAPA